MVVLGVLMSMGKGHRGKTRSYVLCAFTPNALNVCIALNALCTVRASFLVNLHEWSHSTDQALPAVHDAGR